MQSNNSLLYLAIDASALVSVLADIYQGYRNNSFSTPSQLEEKYIERLQAQQYNSGVSSSGRPVVISISGPIVKHTDWDYIGTQSILRYVKHLEKQSDVKGFIFDIDSPGGMISGTAELANAIRNCSKPTIAFTNGMMCSAAYEIGSACDKIIVSPFADAIGSIGTYMHYQDFSAMFEKWGTKIYEVYAPESTEKNRAFRELFEGKKELMEERLSEIAQQFIATVKTYRGEAIKDDGKVFKGAVYTPEKAVAVGLCDELGTMGECYQYIMNR